MNFEEVLTSHGIKIVKGNGRGEIRINCLFCVERGETEDTRQRLGINVYTTVGHCFNCNWRSYNAINLVLRKLRYNDKVEIKEEAIETEDEIVALPEGFEYIKPDHTVRSWYQIQALNYLKARQIPKWQITAKKMGVTIAGTFSHRIIFPVAYNKELVSVIGRDFTGKSEAKYLNSKGALYLYNYPPHKKGVQEIVLSEGIFKCLKIERVARIASAALLGHSLTDIHLKQLDRLRDLEEITIWPDPDKIGIKSTIVMADKLIENNYNVYTIPVPDKQADELSDKEVSDLLRNKIKYTEHIANKLKTKAAFL